jgi:metallophosphoesterase (TIGR00282 family)
MKVLFFGDIVGATAVRHLAERIPRWRREYEIDLVVANAENAAVSDPDDINRGFGTPARVVETLFEAGVDVLTGGNHSWDAPDAALVFEHPRVLRPHNVERSLPGHGTVRLAVGLRHVTDVNLITRSAALPHAIARAPLSAFDELTFEPGDLILVDFHAERQLEKRALGHALDGRVAAVIGTHTHEPTLLTERLPKGTLFVADAGMNGPSGGVLGMAAEDFYDQLRGGALGAFTLATGPFQLGAVLLDFSGRRAEIRRFAPVQA